MEMPIYYVIYSNTIIPCYLIKEGYIPIADYRVDENDDFYCAYSREQFCLSVDVKKDVFEDKETIKEIYKQRIEEKFQSDLIYLIEERQERLAGLDEKI